MAKSVDAGDLKSPGSNTVPVQVRPRAPLIFRCFDWCHRQVVRPQPAKLLSPVQIWVAPPVIDLKNLFKYKCGSLAELVDCTGLENRRGLYLPEFESLRVHHLLLQKAHAHSTTKCNNLIFTMQFLQINIQNSYEAKILKFTLYKKYCKIPLAKYSIWR